MSSRITATLVALACALAAACANEGAADAPSCPPTSLTPGDHAFTLDRDGLTRRYFVHVPPGYDGSHPAPLVFNLHPFVLGGGFFTDIWTYESQMDRKADAAGFLVVQPDGTGFPAAWNGGDECCGQPAQTNLDDVGFIRALADEVAGKVCVDPSRVYSVGMSNGAYLSHRLACEASDLVAAIGPVVGNLSPELECNLTRPVPVLQISGSLDELESRVATVERWRELDACTGSGRVTYQQGDATCTTYDGCAGGVEVTHCIVANQGHCWWGNVSPELIPGCHPGDDLHSPDLLWDFLQRWTLP
ncbi:MAG: PHB depolymerase family esterase [bacterium]